MTKTQSQSKNQTQSQDPIQKYHEEPYKKFFDNDGIPLRWYQTGAGITFIILLILTVVILVIAYILYLKFSKKEGVQDSKIHETEVDLEENEYNDISNYCPGDTVGKNMFINAISTKFSTTENNSHECRNLCSETADCEMYLNEDENTCHLYKDVNNVTMYCESSIGGGHRFYGNVKLKNGLNPAYEIKSETSPTLIDSILEKEEWEISADISVSDTSSQWRNLFHYGNNNETRVPAMWIFLNQLWKLHFRIKTTRHVNDGIDFDVPEQFQIEGEEFNVRIQYKEYDDTAKLTVYINDVFVKERGIGVFTRMKNQQFNLKKGWEYTDKQDEYTDKENYTISNIKMKSLI